MTKLFIFLFAIVLASIAAMWFIENDGRVVVEWLGYRIQTSVAFTILSSIIVVIILTTFLQLLLWVQGLPKRYKKNNREKRREQGLTALTEGFAAIAAGDIKQAKRLTKQATNCLGNIPLTKLLTAQTAQLEGDTDSAKEQFTSMLENKETEIIAIKGLLLQAKKDGDLHKAMFLAEKAISVQPDAAWALSILIDLYKITGKWDNAEEIIRKATKLNVITSHESKRSLALIALAKAHEWQNQGDADAAIKSVKDAYQLLPDFPPLATTYAKLLLQNDSKRKAIKVLEKCWKEYPHPKVATLYMGIFEDSSDSKILKAAEKLVAWQPNSIYGHIELAKVAISMDDVEEAREELKEALSLSETKSLCTFMAEIEKKAGSSNDLARQWLARAETAPADPAWVCVDCGNISDSWSINCKQCKAFDRLEWGGTTKVIRELNTATNNAL
ncbi:MAG: enzyme of heme biosynthesis (hemY-like) [Rickettsiaceae bacterium]|jgi:HemY protein|nr:enzyme of heme biosynthesis (hemY-like) [Rickettsiaceae bacterium]